MLELEPLSNVAVFATLLLAATLLTLMWLRRRGGAARPQAVRVMTLPERKAFELLRRALPRNHMVLAQVPLARFISVPTLHSYADWLHKVGRLCPDLVVCDASSRVVAIVEIATPDHGERSRKRHERVHRVVQAAGIPVHVWAEGSMPGVLEARALFKPRSAADDNDETWAQVGAQGQRLIPVPDIQEVLAVGDDAYALDPLHDPVASGFFDDLDSRRAGLART
jgi:hypothetical protein